MERRGRGSDRGGAELSVRKILIANRGEIAIRVIRSCQEHGLRTVAVYSEIDRDSPHVRLADEAHLLGGSPAVESYLNIPKILAVAKISGADSLHPGYGFLSENPDFARAVRRRGLTFIGPSERSMRLLGDKVAARDLARSLAVPVVPGSHEPLRTTGEALKVAKSVGFPVIIKAAGGGGGKGMRIVRSREGLAHAVASARAEAQLAFGDGRLFIEKYIRNPRHVEVQIIADHHGNVIHLGERECSIQRRHQKVIEESPSTAVGAKLRGQLTEAALKLVRKSGYTNAGTVEFILDDKGHFYFLEVNTRLQVEHPVTEMRVGFDIVWEQIRIAAGLPLELKQEEVAFRGHSIEARIYAEDPANQFYPTSGLIVSIKPFTGLGIREERGIEKGNRVSTYYDPMLSKLVSWGRNRKEAIERLEWALEKYEIFGVKTNISLCLWVLHHPLFRSGKYTTHFLDDCFSADLLDPPQEFLVSAAIAAVLKKQAVSRVRMNGEPAPGEGKWRRKLLGLMRG
jgi:acetyl-CoA carboxylase biotin carboxylase subunit